jgi:hypothetical protein
VGNVFHYKCRWLLFRDNVQEPVNVLAAWVLRIHPTYPRPTLARRSADYYVYWLVGQCRVQEVSLDDVVTKVRPVGVTRVGVHLVRPDDLEASVNESQIQPTSSCVQGKDSGPRPSHAKAFFRIRRTSCNPGGERGVRARCAAPPDMISARGPLVRDRAHSSG